MFAFRAAWATPNEFYYVSDGKIRKRSADGGTPQTVEFSATLQVTRAAAAIRAAQARLHVDGAAPGRWASSRPEISPDGKQIAFAALGDIYVMPVGGKPVNLTKDPRSTPSRPGRPTALSSPTRPTRTASTCSSGSAT